MAADHAANFANAGRTFICKFFLATHVYLRPRDNKVFVSLGAHGVAGLHWQCITIEEGDSCFYMPHPDGETEWCHAFDFNEYQYLPTAPAAPCCLPATLQGKMLFQRTHPAMPLLKSFLLNCQYSDITVDALKKA